MPTLIHPIVAITAGIIILIYPKPYLLYCKAFLIFSALLRLSVFAFLLSVPNLV